MLTGDLIYRLENLHGGQPDDPFYLPVGLASGSQTNLVLTAHEIVKAAGGDMRRVIPPHEERLPTLFPSRTSKQGLQITEIALADGEVSKVRG